MRNPTSAVPYIKTWFNEQFLIVVFVIEALTTQKGIFMNEFKSSINFYYFNTNIFTCMYLLQAYLYKEENICIHSYGFIFEASCKNVFLFYKILKLNEGMTHLKTIEWLCL